MKVNALKRQTRCHALNPLEIPAERPEAAGPVPRPGPLQNAGKLERLQAAKQFLRVSLAVLVGTGALFLPEIGRADEADYVTTNLLTVAGGNFSNADDAYTADINIGFTFTMGGTTYTKVKMSSNGILFFTGPTTEYSNTHLSSMPGSVGVYPLWDDLYIGTGGNESLSRALYYTEGTPGSRVFIVQWGNWYSYNESYEVGTWNVVLYEGSNKIDIYYRNMLGTSVQRGYGASATIGLVANGTYYSEYSYDSAVATQGLLLTYTPSAGGTSPYSLATNMVTAATTASISTYYLAYTNAPKVAVNLSAAPSPATSSATLSWDLASLGQTPTAFNIRYALNAQMANMTQTAAFSCTNGNQYVLSNLLAGSNYYWQVVSTIGTLTAVSTISSFAQFVNHPPAASDGSFSTLQNTPYSGGMTATDVDNTPNTSGLIYSVSTAPSSGNVVINNSATGAFTYTPTTGFSGSDSFIFKAFDGTAYSAGAVISITVRVPAFPPSIGSQPTNLTVVVSSGATFSVTASGTVPLAYQWWDNGVQIGGATNSIYSLSGIRTSDAGSYSVVISNSIASVTSSVAVLTVNKASPVVNSWPGASGITYLQTLSASALSGGGGSVGGAFAFTSPSTTPPVGTYAASVTFTPTDTANYNTVVGSVNVAVGKATPVVSGWPTATGIAYGHALSSSTLSGGTASAGGTFAFASPGTLPNAGTYYATVVFTPASPGSYNAVTGIVVVVVSQAAPNVTAWPIASSLTYGQRLAASALSSGTATPGGTFAFTAPLTIPNAGTYTAAVTFTPADTVDYGAASGTAEVTVSKACRLWPHGPRPAALFMDSRWRLAC